MSVFVDAVFLTADLIHDPAIPLPLQILASVFDMFPILFRVGANHTIIVRSDVQLPSSAASVCQLVCQLGFQSLFDFFEKNKISPRIILKYKQQMKRI